MTQDGGWIQLFDLASKRIRARAHLKVSDIDDCGWEGELESIRTKPADAPLGDGSYVAIFGPWTEPHPVQVAVFPHGASIAGTASADDEPSVLKERSVGT